MVGFLILSILISWLTGCVYTAYFIARVDVSTIATSITASSFMFLAGFAAMIIAVMITTRLNALKIHYGIAPSFKIFGFIWVLPTLLLIAAAVLCFTIGNTMNTVAAILSLVSAGFVILWGCLIILASKK